jgi:hypothetical protein
MYGRYRSACVALCMISFMNKLPSHDFTCTDAFESCLHNNRWSKNLRFCLEYGCTSEKIDHDACI